MDRENTVYAKLIVALQNNRWIALALVLGVVVIGVATFGESVGRIVRLITPGHMKVEASIQEYHIIDGAKASPILLPTIQGTLSQLEDIKESLWKAVLEEIGPDESVEVRLSIQGNRLKVSQPLEISAPGFGVQGMGSFRKIAEVDESNPIDLNKLFAGEYPGRYFTSGHFASSGITLGVARKGGKFESERILVVQRADGYSFATGETKTTKTSDSVRLARRPAAVLVDEFTASGNDEPEARRLAMLCWSHVRQRINDHRLLKLSPHSLRDLQQMHDELKKIPVNYPAKGFRIGEYNVDYIIRGSVIVE